VSLLISESVFENIEGEAMAIRRGSSHVKGIKLHINIYTPKSILEQAGTEKPCSGAAAFDTAWINEDVIKQIKMENR